MDKVVKTTVYVTDPGFTDAVNEVYREFFTANYPARGFAAVTPWPFNSTLRSNASPSRKIDDIREPAT